MRAWMRLKSSSRCASGSARLSDPVEGRERNDCVEAGFRRLPGLEIPYLDLRLGNVAARELGELARKLDARNVPAAPDQLHRRLSRARSDLEDA